MSFFQLILKNMRQRALSTWLTLLSVLLGVGLAVAIMLFNREGKALFGQKEFGYDMIIGPTKASALELVLSAVYDIEVSDKGLGLVSYELYEKIATAKPPQVRWVLPYVVGDLYKGFKVVGTAPTMFPTDWEGKKLEQRTFEYRKNAPLEFAEGRAFHPKKFEAVIGSEIARQTGLKLGSKFSPQHDAGHGQGEHHHEEFTVVGILKRTYTAHDRGLYIPLITYYSIPEHDKGLRDQAKLRALTKGTPLDPASRPATLPSGELLSPIEQPKPVAVTHNPDGTIDIDLPKKDWRITGMYVSNYGGHPMMMLTFQINNLDEAQAVNPAMVMVQFTDKFLGNSTQFLLVIAFLVIVVAAISILVSIYNSVANRRREIAILRALGATQSRIVSMICAEAALIGLLGGIGGLVVGHLLGAVGSAYLRERVGQGINWVAVSPWELLYLFVVVGISALAGLVPAMKAYKTDVATNLVSG